MGLKDLKNWPTGNIQQDDAYVIYMNVFSHKMVNMYYQFESK